MIKKLFTGTVNKKIKKIKKIKNSEMKIIKKENH
jgi:hypothetical protein